MKFRYGDRVWVTRGFYAGLVGTLETSFAVFPFKTEYQVKLDVGGSRIFKANELEWIGVPLRSNHWPLCGHKK